MKKRKSLKRFLSERTDQLPKTRFAEIIRMAAEAKDIVSLGPGEPDFDTPKPIIEFAKKKLDEGFTHYSPPTGRQELKQAIVKKLKQENNIKASPKNIIITSGSTEGILMSLAAMVDAGEEILVPDPGFFTYAHTVDLFNGFPVPMKMSEKTGFQIDLDAFKRNITKRTRGIIINTPGNPTGTVLKRKVLEELADIAVENDLFIISDEAYEKLTYEGEKHISIGSFNGLEENVITLHSFSKFVAMPGWRLGYAVAPEWLINVLNKVHLFTSLCAPTISQVAGVEALRVSGKYTEEMRKEYARRRKLILKRIDEINGLHVQVMPKGAFYAFPRYESKKDSFAYSQWLLEKAKVLTVPGREFGAQGEGFIRMSYATAYDQIEEAMNRLEKVLRKGK
jgi:aminotransferase